MKLIAKLALPIIMIILPLQTLKAEGPVKNDIYNVGGMNIRLALPANYCFMDPSNPNDKLIIDGTKKSVAGQNEVLNVFVDCKELIAWRTGKQKYLNHFGNYQTPEKTKTTSYLGQEAAIVKGICDYFAKQGKKFTETIREESNKAIAKAWKDIKLNETRMLGTFHQDGTSCVAGMFQRLQTDDKSIKDQVSIFSVSVLKGRMIFTYLFAPNEETNVVGNLIGKIKTNHADNLNRNKAETKPAQ